MATMNWNIPANLQPQPSDYEFDLDAVLRSVVGLRSTVPLDAFTAGPLGTDRAGSGVVIEGGLVLTMAYLITEAETIWLSTCDGRVVQGHALAIDSESGFGLVQPLGRLELPQAALGGAGSAEPGTRALLAAACGRHRAIETRIVGRQEFAGYWEYLLEDALFIAPAHPSWGGAALLGTDGHLLGIGSLILQQGDTSGRRTDMNMVVPTSLLPAILTDMTSYGRVNRPPRPWLGLYASESDDIVVVGDVASGAPAERAGVQPGDHLLAVDGETVSDLAAAWRRVWAAGSAGAPVALSLARDETRLEITVISADRNKYLRSPRLH